MKMSRKSSAARSQGNDLIRFGQAIRVENGWIICPDFEKFLGLALLQGSLAWGWQDKTIMEKIKREARDQLRALDKTFSRLEKQILELGHINDSLLQRDLRLLASLKVNQFSFRETILHTLDTSCDSVSIPLKCESEADLLDQVVLMSSLSFKSKQSANKFFDQGLLSCTGYAIEYHSQKIRLRAETDVVRHVDSVIRPKMMKFENFNHGKCWELRDRIKSYSRYSLLYKRIIDSYRRVTNAIEK